MGLTPSLTEFRTWSQRVLGDGMPRRSANDGPHTGGEWPDRPFPSTAPPTLAESRLAFAMVVGSCVLFLGLVPYAQVRLREIWTFIPIYQSALAINDLLTAALLYTQFSILRSRSLLVLACGYLFTTTMVVAHLLSFPGLFAPTGLLAAGPQTTAWLYMFWHGGFPIAVIAYAWLRHEEHKSATRSSVRRAILPGIAVVLALTVALILIATAGHDLLPAIMRGHSYTPAMIVVVSSVWLLSMVALVAVWRQPQRTTIDLWLMVVMSAWSFDIALSAVLNGGRFDLGFYAGRLYGLAASTFILIILLFRTGDLYARLWRLLDAEQTERRRESALRQRIFDTSLDLIFVVDRQGCLIEVSPSSDAVLGYSPGEMIGRSAADFLYPADLDATRNEMRMASRGSPVRNFDCRYLHKSGRVGPMSWKGLWSEVDQQHFFVGRDMTDRLAMEQRLRQAQKMEAIGQLTGGIAHDFNNLLAVIIGMAELTAMAVANDPKVSGMVRQIDQAAERGAKLVKRMLAFARKQSLEPRTLDLNDVVTQSVAILERTLGEHISLRMALGENLWPAVADESQLADSIINLAVNARDAMPSGGHLVIETANAQLDQAYAAQNPDVVPGDYVAINVTDSGSGISPEHLERVFEPFFTTKGAGGGTGLGLSMVYGFIKQSRGHVKIYSEVGHGTSVRLYFPRAQQDVPELTAAVPAEDTSVSKGSETILVVEDDAAVRNMAVSVLHGLNYQIEYASDGKGALEILQGPAKIDLLFTDMIMPNGMSGLDLIGAARKLRPGIRALLTSGYSEQFINSADKARDVRLLAKPYRREELAAAVRAALD
jgi:PAS domain S-box-containing protein